ncbi:MAG: hypothetical protein A3F42_05390 [Gammaproteobacteria bacterium RIFCSPHIGHO2_12_FULL_37_34]|nr:MAG: hypothetical protein A3F42_05390 [Gammaproteobacteria bacterium RIFCSPHIGHO2_12_FULL_37_34]
MVDSVELDKKNRFLALDTSQSYIIQAPAGSGKTELIIQRLLSLLSKVKSPDEILAITFTKKATNEMRSRIVYALQQAMSAPKPESPHTQLTWMLAKNVLERDRQYQWNLLNNPNQLRIQTIDAFCAYLTKQLPLLSHVGSSPAITDQPATLYREAVQEILTHLESRLPWSPALEKLLLHLDNDLNKLHDLLIALLAKRDQWLPYIELTNENNIRKQLEYHFSLVINEKLQLLQSIFPKDCINELLAVARFAVDQLILENVESEIVACKNLTALPGATSDARIAWLGLAKLLLTKNKSWRKRVDKEIGFPALASLRTIALRKTHIEFRERHKKLIERLSIHHELDVALTNLFLLPQAVYEEEQWEILKTLLHVLKVVVAQLHLVFKQSGQIDFIENAQAALLALGDEENPTDLTLALDYRIQHILIDEFQDTSLTQYRLLEKLIAGWEANDGRTLLIVGDPMQSIYRFREAEVGLFLRIWKYGLGAIQLKSLRLSVNFRSTTHIVEWNNRAFQAIFPTYDDVAIGAVAYHASASNACLQLDGVQPAIHGFQTEDDNIQAHRIISLIHSIQSTSSQDSIAILVRSRSNLLALLPALKQANIPYQAVDIEPLASRQIIQDLFSLTCALLHPVDRIAWLALLRAPWCGLVLADLLTIAGEDSLTTIWEKLHHAEVINRLTEDGRKRLSRILPILKSKMEDRERMPLRYWIESTWIVLGGPACLPDYSKMHDVQTYFELLESIHQHDLTIGMNDLKIKVEQLYASGAKEQNSHAIQVMTIHTAKGLEFDTVILPHLESTTPVDDKSLLLYMDYPLANNQVALLLAPIHATGNTNDVMYEFIHKQKKLKSELESDRLFYVATTRAKKRLHLLFNVTCHTPGEYNIPRGSFLEKIWPQIAASFQPEISHVVDAYYPRSEKNRFITRLSSDWRNPVVSAELPLTTYHQQQAGFAIRESTPAIIGTVTHKILQIITLVGKKWWESVSDHYIKRQLVQSGIMSHSIESAIEIIRQSILNTLQDERGQWILSAHLDAQSEFAISAVVEGETQRLVLDRTFIDQDGTRWIIDYKTSALSNQDLNDFLQHQQEKYVDKMRVYSKALQHLTAPSSGMRHTLTKEDRPIRLGLYFPALPAWHEIVL